MMEGVAKIMKKAVVKSDDNQSKSKLDKSQKSSD